MLNEDMLTVGLIVGTHGLRGEVRVVSRTDFPELRFAQGSRLYLFCGNSDPITLEVLTARLQKRVYIVSFVGLKSIEQVERFKGCELRVTAEQLPQLDPGEYLVRDLVGCKVFLEDGSQLGVLTEVLTPGANDVYVVRTMSGKSALLPAIKDCILNVDIGQKRVEIHAMPGLLDDDLLID